MPVMEGVKMGPLDPNSNEKFGQVSAAQSARSLLRHQAALYPRALRRALRMKRQEDRSENLNRAEVEAAVKGVVPKGAEITGAAIRGEEDGPEQYLTVTYRVESGRTGKAAVPYDGKAMPKSHAAGTRAIGVRKARESGLPWTPEDGILDPSGLIAKASSGDEDADELRSQLDDEREAREEAERERDSLREEIQALSQRLGALEAEAGQVPASDTRDEPGEPEEPWDGYEGSNAADVVKRVKDSGDADLARAVLAYEQANGHRATVEAAANAVLDHSGPQD